ncbi:hypothetical protein BX667DRAFT_214872 [Coemansia mojavensis]|nr:hypothetical protein BX667DRAFT_214872 [Coemansia mojavensis]
MEITKLNKRTTSLPLDGVTPLRGKRKRTEKQLEVELPILGFAPQIARTSHSSTLGNRTQSTENVGDEREAEAKYYVENDLIRNVSGVLETAAPLDREVKQKAVEFADQVSNELEAFLNSNNASAVARSETPYSRLTKWVFMNKLGLTLPKEKQMYPWISDFIEFVADKLSRMAPADCQPRELVTFKKFGFMARDADDYLRIDMALTQRAHQRHESIKEEEENGAYKNSLAIIEVKRQAAEQDQAFMQLALYSRNLYSTQINRRFAWGLTICGTIVVACILVNDKILASVPMDVDRPEGRKQFVSLLVNWSMCRSQRLGYDPTIGYDEELNQCTITGSDGQEYNCESVVFMAYSLFGRHTRCFKATLLGSNTEYIIKDAWAYADAKGSKISRDEVTHLQRISDMLDSNEELQGTLPVLEAGGTVQIEHPNGIDGDTTEFILSSIDPDVRSKVPLRIHRRMVLTPAGMPLQKVKSVDELIVIIHDVMQAHTAVLQKCRLLHRDVSVNNILFTGEKETVKGMLIDFDVADPIDHPNRDKRPNRSGTLPYMSIGNLKNNGVDRTALDDWESIIYIICWLGTLSINMDDQKLQMNPDDYEISKWRAGTPEKIAGEKSVLLHANSIFRAFVLDNFVPHPDYKNLKSLADQLYIKLFANGMLSPQSQGTKPASSLDSAYPNPSSSSPSNFLDLDIDSSITDPFERRAKVADILVDQLLQVTQNAKNEALERLRSK